MRRFFLSKDPCHVIHIMPSCKLDGCEVGIFIPFDDDNTPPKLADVSPLIVHTSAVLLIPAL